MKAHGVSITKTSYGTTISVRKATARTQVGTTSEEIISERPAKYLKNVCRLSEISGEIPAISADFTMNLSEQTSTPYIFIGSYDFNANGTIGNVPSSLQTVDATMHPSLGYYTNYKGTFTVGIKFSLQSTEVPSAQWGSTPIPIYFDWIPSSQILEGDVSYTSTTSAVFIPIAKYDIEKTAGKIDVALENVNQYPTLIKAIDQNLVNILDSYIDPT